MCGLRFIGLDVHKKVIAFCEKEADGRIVEEGTLPASRAALAGWTRLRQTSLLGGMEATLFTGWIYDFLKPHALELKVGHPNCKNLSIPKEEARNGSSCNR